MAPRLREDLVATTVVEDAVTYVDVTDPVSGAGFRFYDFEFGLAQQLDGRPLDEIVAWATTSYGLDLTVPALEQFVRQLADMGYLQPDVAEGAPDPGGAQPAAPVPGSTLSSNPFTTVAASDGDSGSRGGAGSGGMPLDMTSGEIVSDADASFSGNAAASPSGSGEVAAAAPEGLLQGDATEYRLKEGGSGLWARGAAPAAPAAADASAGIAMASPVEPATTTTATAPAEREPATASKPEPDEVPERQWAPAAAVEREVVPDVAPKPAAEVVEHRPPISPAADRERAGTSGTVVPRLEALGPILPRYAEPGASRQATPSPPSVVVDGTLAGEIDARPEPPAVEAEAPLAAITRAIAESEQRPPPPAEAPLAAITRAIAESEHRPPPPADALEPVGADDLELVAEPADDDERTEIVAPGDIASTVEAPAAPVSPDAVDAAAAEIAASVSGPVRAPAMRPPPPPAFLDAPLDPPPESFQKSPPPSSSSSSSSSPSSSDPPPSSPSPAPVSWASVLSAEVDQPPRPERRQPPPPEVVVMPPVIEPTAPVPRRRPGLALFLVLAAAVGGGGIWFLLPEDEMPPAPAPAVRVVLPQPTTFYRWFDPVGSVVPGRDQTLGFPSGGRVQDVLAPGTTFSGGETVGRLKGAAAREAMVNQIRARLAYYEQMLETGRAQGNAGETRLAEQKIAGKKQALAESQAALAQLEIRPPAAGKIAEVLAAAGAEVKAGAPVIRLGATGPRADFPLGPADRAQARALPFCRVETIPGSGGAADGAAPESSARAIDCTFPPGIGGAGLTVDLVDAPALGAGTQVRLASARHDGVFPLARSAVAKDGAGGDFVWVVAPAGTAERRAVTLADTVGDLVLVGHGLRVGEAVIVDPPAVLRDGVPVEIQR